MAERPAEGPGGRLVDSLLELADRFCVFFFLFDDRADFIHFLFVV